MLNQTIHYFEPNTKSRVVLTIPLVADVTKKLGSLRVNDVSPSMTPSDRLVAWILVKVISLFKRKGYQVRCLRDKIHWAKPADCTAWIIFRVCNRNSIRSITKSCLKFRQ